MKIGFGETKSNNFIVGRNPVLETVQRDIPVDKVLIQIGVKGEFEKQLRKACKEKNIHLATVPKEKLNQYFRGNHQGVLAFTSLVQYYRIEDILPRAYEDAVDPLIVILDGITDVRNFGAIARSCEVLGAHAIVISRKGGVTINEDAVKTSAGALLRIPICRENSLGDVVEFLQDSGLTIYTTSLDSSNTIDSCDFKKPIAIVMGSEGRGVNPDLRMRLKNDFSIPQVGSIDSLNVSVATGIILYEIQRQRRKLTDLI